MRIQDMPEAEILRRKYDTVDTSVDSQDKLPDDIQDFYENNSSTLSNCKIDTEGYLIAHMAGRVRVMLQDKIVHILIIGDPDPNIAELGDDDTPDVINKKLLEKYKDGRPIKEYQRLPTEITDQKHNLSIGFYIDPQKWYAEKTGQLSLQVLDNTHNMRPDLLFIDVTPKPQQYPECEEDMSNMPCIKECGEGIKKPCCGHEPGASGDIKYPILDLDSKTCRNTQGGSSQYAFKPL